MLNHDKTISGWLTVRAAAADKPAEILIYDQIGKDWFGGDGVSAKEFADALRDIGPKDKIDVHINSPGGNVWDGLAIYNQLHQRRDRVTVYVDGVAASIASVIALAGSKLVMPSNSWMMIHDAAGLAVGNSETMREMAEKLDQHSDMLAGIYAEKTGKSREKMRAMMRDETWFDGKGAADIGLADEVAEEVQIAANLNLQPFRRVPEALTHKPTPPPKSAAGQHTGEQVQKETILALLKQHGKAIESNATEEQILAALSEIVTAGKVTKEEAEKLKRPDEKIIINAEEFRRMEARLKEEKELRIKQEFHVLAIDRPFLDETTWLPKLYADDSLMEVIRSMPISRGTDPLRHSVQNMGDTMIEDYRKMKPGRDRMQFAVSNYHGLQDAFDRAHIQNVSSLPVSEQLRRLHSPRAANTFGASLVTDRLADGFITTLNNRLSALRGFSTEFGVDRLKPRANVQVSKATAGATTQTNPTNFESGDSTTTNVQVAVAQISQDFHTTNDELNSGHTLQRIAVKNAQNFSNALSDIWTALVTVANFGATTIIGVAANFDSADLAPIYALAKNYGQKNLILDGGHLAYLLPTDKFQFRLGEQGAYNFDLIAEQNRWTGATANTVGFICDPSAIAVASGLPISLPSGDFIELGTVQVEELGLTVQVAHWFSRAGRVHWMSYDVMFGAAAGDTTAAEVLVSA